MKQKNNTSQTAATDCEERMSINKRKIRGITVDLTNHDTQLKVAKNKSQKK